MSKINVGFIAKIYYSLDESEKNYVSVKMDAIRKIAAELTFHEVRDKEDGIILKFVKKNPVLCYFIDFYNDLIIITGIAKQLRSLEDFVEIAMEEIDALIGTTEACKYIT
ncbi:MAG: hypothetical protein QXQ64_08955 [Candidatus Bathyarchaeia archaeon]